MKLYEPDWAELELPDIIRANQLVRAGIDFAQFQRWYATLAVPEQAALIVALDYFAQQAGFDAALYQEALQAADLHTNAWLSATPRSPSPRWLIACSDQERFLVFKKFVYLFGKAEGHVYQHEVKESCNHWWHRNLLDERVVRAILNDPKFMYTAMKDDDFL